MEEKKKDPQDGSFNSPTSGNNFTISEKENQDFITKNTIFDFLQMLFPQSGSFILLRFQQDETVIDHKIPTEDTHIIGIPNMVNGYPGWHAFINVISRNEVGEEEYVSTVWIKTQQNLSLESSAIIDAHNEKIYFFFIEPTNNVDEIRQINQKLAEKFHATAGKAGFIPFPDGEQVKITHLDPKKRFTLDELEQIVDSSTIHITNAENRIQEMAEYYLRLGWRPIPVEPKSKKPAHLEWQKRDYKPEDFHKDSNIGIRLGEPSNWLVDIDLDDPLAIRIADFFLPPTASFGRQSRPRSHRLFYCEGAVNLQFRRLETEEDEAKDGDEKAMIVEVRSTKLQTVFPPSIHPEGEEYIWFTDPTAVREITWQELQKAVAKVASATLIAHYWTEGTRQDLALSLAGWLMKKSWSESEVERFIDAITTATEDEEWRKRKDVVMRTARKINQDEAVVGYSKLLEILGEDTMKRLENWLELSEAPQITRTVQTHSFTLKEISEVEFPPLEFVIEDLLPHGLITLAGKPKIGKSWLCLEILRSISDGSPFLGAFQTKPVNAVYYALEDSPRRLKDRILKIFTTTGNMMAEHVVIRDRLAPLHAGGAEQIRKDIEDGFQLIIIDTYGRVKVKKRKANQDAYEAETSTLAPLQELALTHGATILLVHHARKSISEDITDNILGSTALGAISDGIWLLRRQNNRLVLQTLGRDIPPSDIVINFNLDDEIPFGFDGYLEDVERSEARNEILELLYESGKPLSPKQIAEELGRNRSTIRVLLRKMMEDGEVIREDGKYRPARYIKIISGGKS